MTPSLEAFYLNALLPSSTGFACLRLPSVLVPGLQLPAITALSADAPEAS